MSTAYERKPVNRTTLAAKHRERAAAMFAEGLSNRQVADRLGLHIGNVCNLRRKWLILPQPAPVIPPPE